MNCIEERAKSKGFFVSVMLRIIMYSICVVLSFSTGESLSSYFLKSKGILSEDDKKNQLKQYLLYFTLRLVRYAIASASAASSGFGISLSPSSILRAFWTCGFLANQFPAIPALTWSGVYSTSDIPRVASV